MGERSLGGLGVAAHQWAPLSRDWDKHFSFIDRDGTLDIIRVQLLHFAKGCRGPESWRDLPRITEQAGGKGWAGIWSSQHSFTASVFLDTSPFGGYECRKERSCMARWQLQHRPDPGSFIFSNHTLFSPPNYLTLFSLSCGNFHGWHFRGVHVHTHVCMSACVCRINGILGVPTNYALPGSGCKVLGSPAYLMHTYQVWKNLSW